MIGGGQFVPVFFNKKLGVRPHSRLVLAMCRDKHRAARKEVFERRWVVHEHVPGRTAHKSLDPADGSRVGFQHLVEVVIGRAEEKRVVRERGACCDGEFFGQFFLRRGGRVGVRHFHETGRTARDGRPAFGKNIRFVRKTRLAEMHLVVDDSWDDGLSGEVEFDVRRAVDFARELFDAAVFDKNIGLENAAPVYGAGVAEED